MTVKKIAKCYQPLFDLLNQEYKLTPLVSEMDEIISAVIKVNENLAAHWIVHCDVKGCTLQAVNQGCCWSETGYWCVCAKHSCAGKKEMKMPEMKKSAVLREKRRKIKILN